MRTHIIYRSNLSSNMLREYIGLALRAGLLDEDAKERFLITAKGRFYLENFEAIEKLLADKEEIRESISQ